MELHTASEVYANLILMMKHRGVKILETLDQGAFVQQLNSDAVVAISGTRDKSDLRGEALVTCLLLAAGSKHEKSGDFKKLLSKYIKNTNTTKNIIIVSEEPLTIHVKKQIDAISSENPNIFIEHYTYNIFLINLPQHSNVPKHEIASNEEIEEFIKRHHTSKDKLPKILTTDPQAVWLGMRPGMVAKITRPSETAGVAIIYRYCSF
jgi:DNA-directed RNA polymerase subunit H (RpoH/RPB5)